MKSLLSLITVLSLSAVVYAEDVKTEKIYGYTFDNNGITFQVKSGGCTNKKDFQLKAFEILPPTVELIRNRQDICEAYAPYGTLITFSYKEIPLASGTSFSIGNPLAEIIVR